MTASSDSTLSLGQLYGKVATLLSDRLSLFRGLILSGISIDKKLAPSDKYPYSFYTGTSKTGGRDYRVQLRIPNTIIEKYLRQSGGVAECAKYDIVIDSISILRFGALSITAKSIRETGKSDRDLLRRRLEKFITDRGYDRRSKKELPRLVTSILALTSEFSDIGDDIFSNLNIPKDRVRIVCCSDSSEISQHIKSNSSYDIVVLYRGGREDEAMSIFSSEDIIESIIASRVPVCAALGHDIDTPFIYTVADQTYSTPSAFGKEISIHNESARREYWSTLEGIANAFGAIRGSKLTKCDRILDVVETASRRLSERSGAQVDKILKEIEGSVARIYDRSHHCVVVLVEKIQSLSLYAYHKKKKNIMTMETSIAYCERDAYRNKINYIDTLLKESRHLEIRIREDMKVREMLRLEQQKRQNVIRILIGVAVVLLLVVAWLLR